MNKNNTGQIFFKKTWPVCKFFFQLLSECNLMCLISNTCNVDACIEAAEVGSGSGSRSNLMACYCEYLDGCCGVGSGECAAGKGEGSVGHVDTLQSGLVSSQISQLKVERLPPST